MGLIDLKTDLKSLKYGRDEIGGGDSGQPYIKSDINLGDQIVKKNDDGLIRGGAVGAAKASTNDLLRVGKFLKDAPRGPLFIIKQVGLQLSNPKLESRQFKVDRPTRGQGLFTNIGNLIANTANRISNEIGPTRVYNLGVNTALQIPVNAFGIHFNRHGLLPVQDDQTKYLAVVTANNKNGTNRLTNLTTKFALGNVVPSNGFLNTSPTNKGFGVLSGIVKTASRIFGFKNPLPSLDANQTIADYIGGPGSTYGIGRTRIARYDNTANLDLIKEAFLNANFYGGKRRVDSSGKSQPADLQITGSFIPISNNKFSSSLNIKVWGSGSLNNLGPSLENRLATNPTNLKNDLSGYHHWNNNKSSSINIDTLGVSEQYEGIELENSASFKAIDQNVIFGNSVNPKAKTYQNLKTAIEKQIASGSDFSGNIGYNPKVRKNPIDYSNALGVSTQYGGFNTQIFSPSSSVLYKTNDDTPEKKYNTLKNSVNALTGSSNEYYKLAFINRESLNFKYYGDATTDMSGSRNTYRNTQNFQRIDSDILQVVFRIINPFNGNEDQINFSAYINGFKDDFSSTWNEINYAGRAESFYVYDKFKRSVSFNLQIPCFNKKQLYEKHRALGQIASATAGSYNNNFLGGVLIRLNVGNYLVGEYGILDNISYSIPDQATWDRFAGLAMNLDVSFQFKIINQKLPQYQPEQGFFGYLPDTYPNGFITAPGRTDAEQTAINTAFTSSARFPTNNQ